MTNMKTLLLPNKKQQLKAFQVNQVIKVQLSWSQMQIEYNEMK